MENSMHRAENSLRSLIEKWLAPTPATPVRVTRFSRTRSDQRHYVCVESVRESGPLAIFFFRHGDGTWRVFPPEANRPTMSIAFVCSANEGPIGSSNAVREYS
jgi:hypothetical protein